MYCAARRKWVYPYIFNPEAKILRISATLGDLCFEILYYVNDEPEISDILPLLDPETFV